MLKYVSLGGICNAWIVPFNLGQPIKSSHVSWSERGGVISDFGKFIDLPHNIVKLICTFYLIIFWTSCTNKQWHMSPNKWVTFPNKLVR